MHDQQIKALTSSKNRIYAQKRTTFNLAPANSDPISDVIKNCVFKLTWMSATMTKNNDASSKIDINAQKRTTSYLVPANFDSFWRRQ